MKKRPPIIKTAESEETSPVRWVVKFLLIKILVWIAVPVVLAGIVCEIFGCQAWGPEYYDNKGSKHQSPTLILMVLWLVFFIVGLKLRSLKKRSLLKNGPTD